MELPESIEGDEDSSDKDPTGLTDRSRNLSTDFGDADHPNVEQRKSTSGRSERWSMELTNLWSEMTHCKSAEPVNKVTESGIGTAPDSQVKG